MKQCPLCNLPEPLCQCQEEQPSHAIRVYTEKRKYDKPVTIVEGLTGRQCQEFFKQLKSLCACGGAMKEQRIELQGDHRERVQIFLQKHQLG